MNNYFNRILSDGETFSYGVLVELEAAFAQVEAETFAVNDNFDAISDEVTVHANLGLGTAAITDPGVYENHAAFATHFHISMLQSSNNLSDLVNVVEARSNLGLGDSALLDVGTTAGTVAAGDHSHNAVDISYNNSFTGFTSTDVQGAIQELWDLP